MTETVHRFWFYDHYFFFKSIFPLQIVKARIYHFVQVQFVLIIYMYKLEAEVDTGSVR